MTIKWPVQNSRIIPTDSASIVITLSMAGKTVVSSGPIVRPPKGGISGWTSPDLPEGTYTISATALPNADGSGTAQASGAGTITIVPNRNTQASVTMASTVKTVTTTLTNILARPGFTINDSAVITDADGNNVLVADSAVSWKITGSSLSLVKGGVNATFKGVANGNATVTCTFTEVEPSLGQAPVSSPAVQALTASPTMGTAGWPTLYACNPQMTATSSAPAATNLETDIQVPTDFALECVEADGSLVGQTTIVTVGQFNGMSDQYFMTLLNPDGSVRWSAPYDGQHDGPPTLASDGSVYFEEPNDIRVLSPYDGSTIATYSFGNAGGGGAFTFGPDGTLYALNSSGLHAINPNGSVRWSTSYQTYQPLIGPDGTVYVNANYEPANQNDVSILALDPANGTVKWQWHEDTYVPFNVSCSSDVVLVLGGANTANYNQTPSALLLDAHTGKEVASYAPYPGTTTTASPAACIDTHGNVLFSVAPVFAPSYEEVTMSAGYGGGHVWAGPFDTPQNAIGIGNLTSADNGNIYYLAGYTSAGTAALNAYDALGDLLWTHPLAYYYQPATIPMIGADGSVYIRGVAGTVMKFESSASANNIINLK
jgi:hypothetical protein